MNLKKPGFIFIFLLSAFISKAQPASCVLKPPQITIHFGSGDVNDPNGDDLSSYRRVSHSCPSDGYYAFASYTSACFNDDWHTLTEDHTPGDFNGNMLLVNAGREGSVFLRMPVTGLKNNTIYELGVWLINLCKPTKKCPFPLLPNLNIRLETPDGKIIANIVTRDLPRMERPWWSQHSAYFTTPAAIATLMLVMTDNAPSGCGNDFALDDITFRECVKQTMQSTTQQKTNPVIKQPTTSKASAKEITIPQKKKVEIPQVIKPATDSSKKIADIKQVQKMPSFIPLVLKNRENALVKKIETEAGVIKIDIYDNGEIDGDSVSIYHNNTLIRSHERLSQKPISFSIEVDPSQSHHELIMVAENLGSIPPNTSVMIITTASNRYQVFISSSRQKNAKVIFDLKE